MGHYQPTVARIFMFVMCCAVLCERIDNDGRSWTIHQNKSGSGPGKTNKNVCLCSNTSTYLSLDSAQPALEDTTAAVDNQIAGQ